ncbi:MAG: putative O-glycosylation ligase, exosortase A system-associated [Planctomycetes bacterium]|nr:putative O-glycosylation ligase, exosortase A system-associated [Planctomycetota bacterium]
MRDVLVSLFILGSLPTCFRRPFIGLLMFTLLAYMRLQDLTWGFARFQRWSLFVAIVTLAGFFVTRGDKRFMLGDLRNWMMVGLALLVGASLVAGGYTTKGDLSIYIDFLKVLGVAVFTTGVVKNREYLRILVWVVALSFGFYGVKNGVASIVSGGSLQIIQGPGGMLSDNNDFALALCMGAPMLLCLGFSETRPLLKRVFIGMVPLMLLTIMATHSRGAFLAISATIPVLVWRSRNRVAGFAVAGLLALTAVLVAPKSYVERLSTIKQYETEGSAKGRLEAWGVAFNMIQSNPVLGVGFDKFQRNYKRYDPKALTEEEGGPGTRVAHNSYLQIWAECGTPAFLLYLGLIGLSFLDLWRLRREAERRYYTSWILSYATMFEASMAAFVVGSFFLNRAHFDLFYHFVAIIAVFGVIARAEMASSPSPTAAGGARGPLEWVGERGFGRGPRQRGFARAGLSS